MDAIPWYRSPVFTAAIVSLITQLIALGKPLGLKLAWTSDEVTALVTSIAQVVAIAAAGFAVYKRGRSQVQPLARSTAHAEQLNSSPGNQAGAARLPFLLTLAILSTVLVASCVGTKSAYESAKTPDAIAFVISEHYAVIVNQAADLAAKPTTPPAAIRAMQAADKVARPAVEQLRSLRDAFVLSKGATDQVALQAAINKAVLAVADLVRTVRVARGGI